MKRNNNLPTRRIAFGLSCTLLAGMFSPAWGETLPDINLPPYAADDDVPATANVTDAAQSPPDAPTIPMLSTPPVAPTNPNLSTPPVAPEQIEVAPRLENSQPRAESATELILQGNEPPSFTEPPKPLRAIPAQLGAPRELKARAATDIYPLEESEPKLPIGTGVDENAKVEIIHERYADGSVKAERGVKQDAEGNYILHGEWRWFDPKGAMLAEGAFVNNVREGAWKRYYRGDDAPLFTTETYRDFQGPFVSQAYFSKGKLEKVWSITDSKQRVVSAIEFHDGERHGTARWYHTNGKLAHQVQYTAGRIEGEAELWDENGQLLRTEVYEAGRRIGVQASNYPNGQKHVEAGCLFAPIVVKSADDWWNAALATYETEGHDERHGRFVVWHANGLRQREGEFASGQPVGKMTWWYSNGQKQLEGSYVQGKALDTWTWWHPNGQKSIVGKFEDNTPIGDWMWWHEDGKVAQRIDLDQVSDAERSALLKKFPLPTSPMQR